MADKPKSPPEVPADVVDLIRQSVRQQLALVGLFAPTFPEQEIPRLLEVMTQEQVQIESQIMPSMYMPEQIRSHPRIMMRLWASKPDGTLHEEYVSLVAPKVLSPSMGADRQTRADALSTTMILATLSSPGFRALLRIRGYHYDFVGVGSQDPAKRISLS